MAPPGEGIQEKEFSRKERKERKVHNQDKEIISGKDAKAQRARGVISNEERNLS
jgi:hypothetical protein